MKRLPSRAVPAKETHHPDAQRPVSADHAVLGAVAAAATPTGDYAVHLSDPTSD